MKRTRKIISILLSIVLVLQGIGITAFADEKIVLPENLYPDFNIFDMLEMRDKEKEPDPTPEEIIDALFEGVNDYEGYISLLKEKRNDIEPSFDEYKPALLNKVSVSEEMFEDILGGIDKTDAVIMALYVNNTEITLDEAKQMQESFITKFSKYEALDTYFLIKEAADEKAAKELKDMLIGGYEAYSLMSAMYLSAVFGVTPSQTGVYKTSAECIEADTETDEWTEEGIRLNADPNVLKSISGGRTETVKSISFEASTMASTDVDTPSLSYGEVAAPYLVQNSVTESIDIVHQDVNIDYNIVNLDTFGGLPFGLKLHYDSSESQYFDIKFGIDYSEDYPKVRDGDRSGDIKREINPAAGWSWGLPYIEEITVNNPLSEYQRDTYLAIHMPDGAVYYTDIAKNMQNPNMCRYIFTTEFYKGFTNGDKEAAYGLINKDTLIEYYFDNTGRLIGMDDQYGNSVKYKYEFVYNKMGRLKEIEDDAGRKIKIDYSADGTQITITAPDGNKTELTLEKAAYSVYRCNLLTSIKDPEGKITEFSYQEFPTTHRMSFDYPNKDGRSTWPKTECYAALGTITYPTGAKTTYKYYGVDERQWQNIPYEVDLHCLEEWTSMKLGSRVDRIGDEEYGMIKYEGAMDSAYEYGVTVTQGYAIQKYRFNEFRYCKLANKEDGNGNSFEKKAEMYSQNVYDSLLGKNVPKEYPFPSKITTTNKTNSASQTTVEEYEYLLRDDLLGKAKSYTVNGRKTEYEYDGTYHDARIHGMYDEARLREPTVVKKYIDNNSYIKTQYEYGRYTGAINEMTTGTVVGGNYPEKVRTTKYTYDDRGNIVETATYENINGTLTEASNTSYDYTYANKITPYITSITAYDGSKQITSTYTYDISNGLLMTSTDPNGNTTNYTYDIMGRVLSETYADNTSASVSYAFPSKTVDGVTVLDQTVTYTDPTNRKSRITYDSLGREIGRSVCSDYEWITTSSADYNEKGQINSTSDAYDNKTSYEYDNYGRLIRTTNPDGTFSQNIYLDGMGMVGYSSETGNLASNFYNEFGELVAEAYNKTPGGMVYLSNYYYNNLGQMVKVHDAQGAITKYTYDSLGNMTKSEKYDAINGDTVPEGSVQRYTYEYDVMGNVLKTTDSNNHTTQNVYNKLGQVTQAIDGLGQSEYYEYDANGNVIKTTDRNGTVYANTYDVRNRVIKTYSIHQEYGTSSKTWTYDNAGRILKMSGDYGNYPVSYTYDDIGRLETVTEGGKTLIYCYDWNNNLVEVIDYFGNVTDYTYNSRGLVTKAGDITFEYNKDGTLKEQKGPVYTQTYTYNDRALPTEMTVKSPSGMLYSEVNTYDTYGNITETAYEFGNISDNTVSGRHKYSYDVFGQLKSETYEKDSFLGTDIQHIGDYMYDYAGNMTLDRDKYNAEVDNTIDANNRLIKTDCFGEVTNLTYDNSGNLTRVEYYVDNDVHIEYDTWGRMEWYSDWYTEDIWHGYYANGLRAMKQRVDGYTTNYYYMGDVIINETVRENVSLSKTVSNTIVGSRIISCYVDGEKFYYIYNTHGDVVLVLNEWNEDPVQAYLYEAYGNLHDDMAWFYEEDKNGYIKDFDNPIRYAGQYWDKESGYYYMRARYYSPMFKRFTQEDPIRDGMNWYMYAANNPIRFVDINGLYIELRGNYTEVMAIWENLCMLTDDELILTQKVIDLGDGEYEYLDEYTVSIGTKNNGSHPTGTELIRKLVDNILLCEIHAGSYKKDEPKVSYRNPIDRKAANSGKATGSHVGLYLDQKVEVLTENGELEVIPKHIELGHELIHAWRGMEGKTLRGTENLASYYPYGEKNDYEQAEREELETVGIDYSTTRGGKVNVSAGSLNMTENALRAEHGFNKRIRY